MAKHIIFDLSTAINQNFSDVISRLNTKQESKVKSQLLEVNNGQPSSTFLTSEQKSIVNGQLSTVNDCNVEKSAFSGKAILVKYPADNLAIFELNPGKRWPIASLTKLMTSLIALEKMGLEEKVVMSEKAVSSEGTAGDFKAGEVFKAGDLVKAILVASSNDAAVAIAENFGGREPSPYTTCCYTAFINEMQRKAAELTMLQTSFFEPTGLSFINQSTIIDLVKLVNYIYLNYPELLEISRQKEITITELTTGQSRKLFNINYFAGQPDFLGGKTGYIDEAGRNLIALFNINGKIVLTITLGAEDAFGETERLKKIVQQCR